MWVLLSTARRANSDDVHQIRILRAAQRRDNVRRPAAERVEPLEPLILGRVAERRAGVEETLRRLAIAGLREVLRIEIEQRLLVVEDARRRRVVDDAPDVGGDRLERRAPGDLQRHFAFQIRAPPAQHVGLRDLLLEIDEIHAAIGRDRVAVALGADEQPRPVRARRPLVLRGDRAHGVVVKDAGARQRAQVIEIRAAMTRLADQAEQTIGADEPRQDVVLDLARDALLVLAVTRRDEDLPVVAEHDDSRH